MAQRTVEDRLREEYFVLLAESRRVLEELEAEVRYCLLPLSRALEKYEQVVVTSRIKDCESALGALRRRQEGATFDSDRGDSYSLADLNDLAGVRVLVFLGAAGSKPTMLYAPASNRGARIRFTPTRKRKSCWHTNITATALPALGFAVSFRSCRC